MTIDWIAIDWATAKGVLFLGLLIGWVAVVSPRSRRRRGRRLLSKREVRRLGNRNQRNGSGLSWGGRELPHGAETSHFLVVGTTGSGKTLTIKQLMAKALPTIRQGSGSRALIYDSKQDVLSTLAGADLACRVVTLNPFDTRCASWDMAQDITAPATALQVATILIPEEKGNNRFFSDAARDLLTGTMRSFIENTPQRWTLADIVYGMRSKERLRAILERTEHGRDLLDIYFSEEKTLHNILATVRSRLSPFESIAAMWMRASESVSLREWVQGEFVLVLASNESVRAPLDAINRVIFKRITELVLAEEESAMRRSWFFLDEVREAGKLPGLSPLLIKGRSKGACVVLGFQDVAGMKEAYGEHLANEIIGQCSHKAILRLESDVTAEWAARILGEFEVIEVLNSSNSDWTRKQRTRSEQFRKVHAVLPSEFLTVAATGFENGLQGYFVTPFIGAFRSRQELRTVLREIPTDNPTERNYSPRPDSDQYLKPWTPDDLGRLRLEIPGTDVQPEEGHRRQTGKLRLVKRGRPRPELSRKLDDARSRLPSTGGP